LTSRASVADSSGLTTIIVPTTRNVVQTITRTAGAATETVTNVRTEVQGGTTRVVTVPMSTTFADIRTITLGTDANVATTIVTASAQPTTLQGGRGTGAASATDFGNGGGESTAPASASATGGGSGNGGGNGGGSGNGGGNGEGNGGGNGGVEGGMTTVTVYATETAYQTKTVTAADCGYCAASCLPRE